MEIGHKILRYGQVTSTIDLAWDHANDVGNHGLVVLADEQTAGRGRRGDRWLAPPGSSLLLSILIHTPGPCRKPAVLSLWAGLAVCSVIDTLIESAPTLKWPNDVLLLEKKCVASWWNSETTGLLSA